jgi:hypothetical protein
MTDRPGVDPDEFIGIHSFFSELWVGSEWNAIGLLSGNQG